MLRSTGYCGRLGRGDDSRGVVREPLVSCSPVPCLWTSIFSSQLEWRARVVQKGIFDSARCDPGPFIIRKGSAVMGRISEDSESSVGISFA